MKSVRSAAFVLTVSAVRATTVQTAVSAKTVWKSAFAAMDAWIVSSSVRNVLRSAKTARMNYAPVAGSAPTVRETETSAEPAVSVLTVRRISARAVRAARNVL